MTKSPYHMRRFRPVKLPRGKMLSFCGFVRNSQSAGAGVARLNWREFGSILREHFTWESGLLRRVQMARVDAGPFVRHAK